MRPEHPHEINRAWSVEMSRRRSEYAIDGDTAFVAYVVPCSGQSHPDDANLSSFPFHHRLPTRARMWRRNPTQLTPFLYLSPARLNSLLTFPCGVTLAESRENAQETRNPYVWTRAHTLSWRRTSRVRMSWDVDRECQLRRQIQLHFRKGLLPHVEVNVDWMIHA
jgi:hypothetical protein